MVQEQVSPRPATVSEPLLEENPERFCMFPIKYQDVWEMYKKAEASFWTGQLLHSHKASNLAGVIRMQLCIAKQMNLPTELHYSA